MRPCSRLNAFNSDWCLVQLSVRVFAREADTDDEQRIAMMGGHDNRARTRTTQVWARSRPRVTCGQIQTTVPPTAVTSTSALSGLSENAAALLSYLLGWISGIIFF